VRSLYNISSMGSNTMISNDNSPSVTVVVINYNGGQHVLKCIQSLLQTDYGNYKVVVLDNASRDYSTENIRKKFPNIELVNLNTNVGYAGGANLAISLFQDDYIVILNNDIYVDSNWLHELIKTAESNPKAIMIGPRVLHSSDRTTSFAGAYITYPIIGSGIIGINEKHPNYRGIVKSSYAAGAALLLRRNEALSIGNFDSDYFLYWEEIDFAWRAWICGYQVLMNLDACVYHDGGKSTTKTLTSRRMSYLSHRNRIATYNKYLSNQLLLIGLLGEIVNGSLILMRSLFGSIDAHNMLQGYFQAILWVFKNLKLLYSKRLHMERRCKYWGQLPPNTRITKVHLFDVSRYIHE